MLTDYFHSKSLLIVLDNCEHLIGKCAEIAEQLLRACPNLKILATSRETFSLRGEIVIEVPPLSFPSAGVLKEDLEEYAAVRLFGERAKSVATGFRITERNSTVIGQICRQLDGIPLAIELAAAKVRVLTPEQISERLADRFHLLTDGPRGSHPRHRTLKAAMDWSYKLLADDERRILRRLAVFAGGWTLDAADAVAEIPSESPASMLSTHVSLVDKSLVVVKEKSGGARYQLLETVRQYGIDRLAEVGETQSAGRRHAEYFTELAEKGDPELRGAGQLEWLRTLESEHDNIRVALDWMITNEEADLAFRLVAAMGWFWFMRGNWGESRHWLSRALTLSEGADPVPRARAVYRAGGLQLIRGNLTGYTDLVESALQVCRAHDDREGVAWCQNLLGQAETFKPATPTEASPFLQESLEQFTALGDEWGQAWTLRYVGQVADLAGNYAEGKRQQAEAAEMFSSLGDQWDAAHSLYLLAQSEARNHEDADARAQLQQVLQKCSSLEDRKSVV